MRIYHDQQKLGDHWGSREKLSADFIYDLINKLGD